MLKKKTKFTFKKSKSSQTPTHSPICLTHQWLPQTSQSSLTPKWLFEQSITKPFYNQKPFHLILFACSHNQNCKTDFIKVPNDARYLEMKSLTSGPAQLMPQLLLFSLIHSDYLTHVRNRDTQTCTTHSNSHISHHSTYFLIQFSLQ